MLTPKWWPLVALANSLLVFTQIKSSDASIVSTMANCGDDSQDDNYSNRNPPYRNVERVQGRAEGRSYPNNVQPSHEPPKRRYLPDDYQPMVQSADGRPPPGWFVPDCWTCICGRGKAATEHSKCSLCCGLSSINNYGSCDLSSKNDYGS